MVKWLTKFFSKPQSILNDGGLFATRSKFIDAYIKTDEPWAVFEVLGFEDNGQIKVEFNWNAAFIERLDVLGFTAETESDTVQLFFYASQMKPTSLLDGDGDESVQLDDLPQLSDNVNRLVR
jgi:hypothetical protein